MHAIFITFPGHLAQTTLSIRSANRWFPEITEFSLVVDDIRLAPWSNFTEDLDRYVRYHVPDIELTLRNFSEIPALYRCLSGWWRQQLIKLLIDTMMPDDQWFVIDGDVIFESRCDYIGITPISRRGDTSTPVAQLTENYVKRLLGVEPGFLESGGQRVGTSPIPFRYLDRELLTNLRRHVESKFNKDFLSLHLDWFLDQTIIAYEDPPTRMIMSEWELIEVFQHRVLCKSLPLIDMGSGYPLDVPFSQSWPATNVFRHAYMRDIQIESSWFAQNDLEVWPEIWQRSRDWIQYNEPHKLS